MVFCSAKDVVQRATMMFIVLIIFTTVNVVRGETLCTDDEDCSSDQYCYAVSGRCVDYTRCERYNRLEANVRARQPSQCGPCRPGYNAEVVGTGVPAWLCKNIINKQKVEQDKLPTEPEKVVSWEFVWVGSGLLAAIATIGKLICCVWKSDHIKIPEKLYEKIGGPFTRPSPSAPIQDEAAKRLNDPTLQDEGEPQSSVIEIDGRPRDTVKYVTADPFHPPNWVDADKCVPDCNDNIANGVAIPISTSSHSLHIEPGNEDATNPSAWTPEPINAPLPTRSFAILATNIEEQDNVSNAVRLLENCSSSAAADETAPNDGPRRRDEPPESRYTDNTFFGPNVQISQTIHLSIAKNGAQ